MHDNMYELKKTCKNLEEKFSGEMNFDFFLASEIDSDVEEYEKLKEVSEKSQIVYLLLHGGVSNFKKFIEYREKYGEKLAFVIHSTIDDETRELNQGGVFSVLERERLNKYYILGGEKNYKNMFLYSINLLGKSEYEVEDFHYPKWEGIYYKGEIIENEDEFKNNLSKEKPIIGIIFHSHNWQNKMVRVIDCFIKKIEERGGSAFPIFTNCVPNESIKSKGTKWAIERYFRDESNKVIPSVIINLLGYSQSIFNAPGDGKDVVEKSIFEDFDIPVIQAMSTYQNYNSWLKEISGVDPMSLTTNVYYPEFDGQIISTTCCTHETIEDEGGTRNIYMPIVERVEKICKMAISWANLSRKSNEDKKVAIILHNMPPRNDMIGCAFGLDTPNSVYNIVEELTNLGVKREYDFKDGDEIIKKIISTVSNDQKWLSEEKVLEQSVDKISKTKYSRWFEKLDEKVREKMQTQWGAPPGEFMVFNDILPVPGILNGNFFIGLQPARGNIARAEEMYHNTDIFIPHQYFSFYKWIKEEFKADVIYHIGTHGTLEWLPGKEIGLSNSCCPDFCIDDIPHLYVYSINVTGEGLQAKRRSYATLISHMIPSLTMAGEYEEIEEIDELIKQYYQAKISNDKKIIQIKEEIVDKVIKNNYHLDLNISKIEILNDFFSFINKLHCYIEELKNSVIKDGLHILGELPQGMRCTNLIQTLMRIENKGMLPGYVYVAKSLDIDIEKIEDELLKENQKGKTNLMILDEINNITTLIIDDILNEKEIKKSYLGYEIKKIEFIETLAKNIKNRILPKLKATKRELTSVKKGIEGEFILPGQSGCPTRGNIDILPTGTNFYAIDPNKIPSRAAWKTGVMLGEKLLERYVEDEGKLPENIALLIYGGETMKTNGDDIAQALFLMGVRPVWLNEGDRVIGLEIIPYEELKRPRIDVTFRITGLFRDTFPNLIKLLEEAVNLVSQLDEDVDKNYIRKNINNDIEKLIKEGCSAVEAEKMSKLRVFGCPPGTYGAGVGVLINSQNWKNVEDLGKAYVNWSSYAYNSDYHGLKVENMFLTRMSKIDATVKNESSVEIDMLESDDYYTYHGGLVSAVRYASKKIPQSYTGDASNPNKTKIKNLKEETARIIRARILNPKWIEGLQRHGYKGAQEMSAMVDIFFGWDATANVSENWMYDKIMETYIENPEIREWIQENNSYGLLNMTERLLEANQRKMWNASKEKLEALRKIYLDIEGDIEGYE